MREVYLVTGVDTTSKKATKKIIGVGTSLSNAQSIVLNDCETKFPKNEIVLVENPNLYTISEYEWQVNPVSLNVNLISAPLPN